MGICEEGLFKSLFVKYHGDIERFMISRGANQQEALDIAQESFVRLWQKCKEITSSGARPFLYTTSSRILIDEYRKKQTREKYKLSLSWAPNRQDAQYQMEMEEFREHLEQVIASMKEGAREVFVLHRFESMKYKEIAAHLGISVKAVEKRMHSALSHLANHKIPKIP